jgi:hypothetical protein
MNHKASCHCGKVAFEVSGDIGSVIEGQCDGGHQRALHRRHRSDHDPGHALRRALGLAESWALDRAGATS